MQDRIEFIDLAKGVCILMVVAVHCGLPITLPGCLNLRMPLYFILSGLFFKTYDGFGDFIRRKTNKILVPFLFFYLLAYVIFYVANWIAPGIIRTDASGILDVFTQRQYFNGPIWFLICLFWANIYFYLVQMFVRNDMLKVICVLLICGVGILLGKYTIFLPCMMDVAMTALPFFYVGYLLKRTNLLTPNRFDRYNLLFAIVLWGVAFCAERYCNVGNISFHYNRYHGNFALDTVVAICSVMAVLYLCKAIKHIPVVSYCGRYSIILLCTHHLFYRPLLLVFGNVIPEYSIYVSAVLTIVLCIISIPICVRFIPHFCAQEELFKGIQQKKNSII